MSLEIIGTLASVATLVVVVYIQVKPAVNRWATVSSYVPTVSGNSLIC